MQEKGFKKNQVQGGEGLRIQVKGRALEKIMLGGLKNLG